MKLENQVCSLEQSKKLNELLKTGEDVVPANLYHFNGHVVDEAWGNDYYPAFTVAELGVMLPDEVNGDGIFSQWIDGRFGEPGRQFTTSLLNAEMQQGWETEAQALAAMLIYLLENNLTTPEEVNTKLTA